MVQLLESDNQTKEVLLWKGLHVFHYGLSSCSQKLRIYLNLKGLDWQSHPIDIVANEHLTPFYLGINPRGLLPCIVENGAVHIESNDIILHLEKEHPQPSLIPQDGGETVATLLRHENDLHLDLRTLTFRFLFDPKRPTKSKQDLERYATTGTGTVRGARDHDIDREIAFWSGYLENGVSDEQAQASAGRMREAFARIDEALANSKYVLGDDLSIVDIAWLVYVQRLTYAGYPVRDLHPHLADWQSGLMTSPAIANELELPEGLREMIARRQYALTEAGQTLAAICFPKLQLGGHPDPARPHPIGD